MLSNNVKFKVDSKHIKAHLKRLAKEMYRDTRLATDVKEVSENVADVVKHYLITTSTRNPAATEESDSGLAKRIASHIRGMARPTKIGVEGGIGQISELDSSDPLLGMDRLIRDDSVRLWRILEWGTAPHLIEARNYPELRFWWKRKDTLFKGPVVKHPGTTGRKYFAMATYDGWKIYRDGCKAALTKMFDRLQ